MRLAVVSDIHGNLPALQAVLADAQRRGADTVVNLGDHLSGPLLPLETARFLMTQPWIQLAGNHERQLLTHAPAQRGASDAYAHDRLTPEVLAWLSALPPTARLDDVLLCHATPWNDTLYFLETVEADGTVRAATAAEIGMRLTAGGQVDAALVLCGHTHVPRCVRLAGGPCIVNPGSVGLPAYDDVHPVPHVVANGSPDARYALVERVGAGWKADLVAVRYDHDAMAALAREHGRADWASALAFGDLREFRRGALQEHHP